MDNKWNKSEFMAFLFLYASHVDMDYSEEEKEKIKSLLSQKSYSKIYDQFMDMTDYQSLEAILSYKGLYYPTVDQKQELLDNLKALFMADGDFSEMERELLHFMEKLM